MPTTTPATIVPGDRVAALDGLRGLAVLVVIVHNAGYVLGSTRALLTQLAATLSGAGWVGVQLFFVLSGYLITGILLDSRGRPGYFRSFYLRRTLRIFPPYYALLLLTLLAAPLLASPALDAALRAHQWTFWLYVSNWTQPFGASVPGWSHLWSLAVEEQFYLAWPLLVRGLGRRGLVPLSVAMVVAGPAVRLALRAAELPADTAYQFTIARWDALAAGALLAALLREAGGSAHVRRWSVPALVTSLAALGAVFVLARGLPSDDRLVQVAGQSLVTVACTALLALALRPADASPLARALARRPLRETGRYSYALYLAHFPIHTLLAARLGAWVTADDSPWRLARGAVHVGAVLVLSLAAAMASWRLLERPLLRLKDRVAPRAA